MRRIISFCRSRLGRLSARLYIAGLREEREYAIENLAMLISAGGDVALALHALCQGARSPRLRRVLGRVKEAVRDGSALADALADTALFPNHVLALVRSGERSGRLAANLRITVEQNKRDRELRSRIYSALIYPLFVICIALIVGLVILWYVLPKLSTIFHSLTIALPPTTRALMAVGSFLEAHGAVVVPAASALLILAVYILFFFRPTAFAGQAILLCTPGVGDVLRDVELSRFGYLFGTLLTAGMPVTDVLSSLADVTALRRYGRLYRHLHQAILQGESFSSAFTRFRGINRLMPRHVQEMIAAAERSGRLAEIPLIIGQTYAARAETTSKNLTALMEPILLIFIWAGVTALAFSIISPIYGLLGGLGQTF